MRQCAFRSLIAVVLLLLPISAFAQEAVISGSIADATGGVLPGVVIRAVNQASGNSFEAVTDGTGAFRIPLRAVQLAAARRQYRGGDRHDAIESGRPAGHADNLGGGSVRVWTAAVRPGRHR